jgi:REP element-mobilizing transposase RayT
LAREETRLLVETALRHFDGVRYRLGEHVIMPNHVHALVMPLAPWTLSEILHTWKSYTAKQINRELGQTGPFWQKESFDHIVRSEAALTHFTRYIRDNPKGKK